ncbi:hypothetical protein [Enterococcus hirae]
MSTRHLELSYELVRQINSKGFQGVFSMFLHHEKDVGKFHQHQKI